MRTNIIINDQLMEEALKVSGLSTKKAVVEAGKKPHPCRLHEEKVLQRWYAWQW